ncbi:hypothetical protein N7G274_010906 [Stereocaulon virgatum]|uniref:Uncharacterized protein n=1 Tax=Stereocaulon virgatum TaxID=373712 RepID=A0ABR3ZTD8_9LECA
MYEQQQYRQTLTKDANALVEEEQRLEQTRQKLLSDARTLEKQGQEQELQRQQLVRDASTITEQEQNQGQRQQQLLSNTRLLDKQEQEQEQLRQILLRSSSRLEEDQVKAQQQQRLVRDISMLEKQEREQEVLRERLASDAIALKEQELEQEYRKQKLSSGAIALREDERQQEKMHQKLIGCAGTLREQEEIKRNKFNFLQRRKRKASQLVFQEQKQKEGRENLAAVAGELVVKWEKVHQRKLAEYESDLEKQELMQNEELERLMANTSELRRQEKRQKSMESKVLGNELDEPETFHEQDERDMGELQRRGQEELVEPELLFPSEPDCGRTDAGPSTTVLPAQQCPTEAVQKGVTETSDSAPKDMNSPARERGRQHGESQVNGQDGNSMKENYELEAQERGQEHEEQKWNEYRMEDSGQEEKVDEGEVLDDAEHNDTAGGDKQTNEAQKVVLQQKDHARSQCWQRLYGFILQHTPPGFDVKLKAVVPEVPRMNPVAWYSNGSELSLVV